jgi:hypothetical protein
VFATRAAVASHHSAAALHRLALLHDPPAGLVTLTLAPARRQNRPKPAADETLRGTPCRKVTASDGAIGFSVWIDSEHVRQAQTVQPTLDQTGTMTKTLELWDFGVAASSPPGVPG